MKQNCKKTFIHKNNYYLATSKNVWKGGKFKGKYDLGGGGLVQSQMTDDPDNRRPRWPNFKQTEEFYNIKIFFF